MKTIQDFELPDELRETLKKAKKTEWITVAYLVSVIIIMYITMGSSQAMKSAWLEDLLGLVPSTAFLISAKVNSRPPNQRFKYGYHRVFSISFLTGAVALLGMGIYMIYDSSMALVNTEHPTIGSKLFFGHQVWMGWIMIAALFYSAVPAMILGFKKLPLAKKIHNKVLFIDSKAQKADYLTAFAAIIGVLGIGAGIWWLDAVAAMFISFSVLRDGIKYIKVSVLDLMDRRPVTISGEEDKLVSKVKDTVLSWDWVTDAEVRFRETGQVYFGEIVVIPNHKFTLEKLDLGYPVISDLHWKLYDFTISPVKKLPNW